MRRLLSMLLLLGVLTAPFSAHAADKKPTGPEPLTVRSAVGIILVSGLVGGVLGLSTLSFFSDPENKIHFVTIGAGAGVAISAIYLGVVLANQPPASEEDEKDKKKASLELPNRLILPYATNDSAGLLAQFRF